MLHDLSMGNITERLLRRFYLDEGNSILKCSKLFGVSKQAIKYHIKKHGLYKNTGVGKIKYQELHDKKWLFQKYWNEKLSMWDICRLLNVSSPNTVRKALNKHEIAIRNISQSTTARFPDNINISNTEVLDGSLLGDCHLHVNNKFKVQKASIVKNNKFIDHLRYFSKFVVDNVNEAKISPRKNRLRYKGKWKDYDGFNLRTSSSEKLVSYYERWYPISQNRKKSIPIDLKLTPTVILHWFMDDGYSYYRKNRRCVIVEFCSESFTYKENLRLKKELERFHIKCSIDKDKSGYRIRVISSSTNDFFNLIGECPVNSLRYKWKIV